MRKNKWNYMPHSPSADRFQYIFDQISSGYVPMVGDVVRRKGWWPYARDIGVVVEVRELSCDVVWMSDHPNPSDEWNPEWERWYTRDPIVPVKRLTKKQKLWLVKFELYLSMGD